MKSFIVRDGGTRTVAVISVIEEFDSLERRERLEDLFNDPAPSPPPPHLRLL